MAQHAELHWTDVDSSNVASIGYHEDTKTLCVEFHNGGLYTYKGVENNHYVSLVHSESVGRYFNTVIKVLYPYTKFVSRDDLLSSL